MFCRSTPLTVVRRVSGAVVASLAALTLTAVPVDAAPRPVMLVLGDSISAGYQPVRGDAPRGGYPAQAARRLADRGTPVRIANLACTGETARTMRTGGHCRYGAGSQRAAALAYLRRHPETRYVTVSLGANDVFACLDRRRDDVDLRCTGRAISAMRADLTATLRDLRRAAPHAQVLVLDYYDPFQAGLLLGRDETPLTRAGRTVRTQVNGAVRAATRDAGARTVYVTRPFEDGWFRRVDLPGHGKVPVKVARICTWTWMCSRQDIHPNDAGYRVIGDEVYRTITRS